MRPRSKVVVEKPTVSRHPAVPLEIVKTITPPQIPGVMDTMLDVKLPDIEALTAYVFGILVHHKRLGEWLLPYTNVAIMKPIPNIDWDSEEFCKFAPEDLLSASEARSKK